MYSLLDQKTQEFLALFSQVQNQKIQTNPLDSEKLSQLRDAFIGYVSHVCLTSLAKFEKEKVKIENKKAVYLCSAQDIEIAAYTQFLSNRDRIDAVIEELHRQGIKPTSDGMREYFSKLHTSKTKDQQHLSQVSIAKNRPYNDSLQVLTTLTENILTTVQKKKTSFFDLIDKPYKAYLANLLSKDQAALDKLEQFEKEQRITNKVLPIIHALENKKNRLDEDFLQQSYMSPEEKACKQSKIEHYRAAIKELDTILEKNQRGAPNQSEKTIKKTCDTIETNFDLHIIRPDNEKALENNQSNNVLIKELIAAHKHYVGALGAFPLILDGTITALRAEGFNYDIQGSNQTLIHFINSVTPKSCPPIVSQMIGIYIQSTGIGHRVLTPAMQEQLQANLIPFIEELFTRSSALTKAKDAYLFKNTNVTEQQKNAPSVEEIFLINSRKKFLESLDIETEIDIPNELSKLAKIGTNLAGAAGNIQGMLTRASAFDKIDEAINAVKNIDTALSNPFTAYALKNVPQAEQLFNYYRQGKDAICSMSNLLSKGFSALNDLGNNYLQKIFKLQPGSNLQQGFEKQLAFFRFYQLVAAGKLDASYQRLFFTKYIEELNLAALKDTTFSEYTKFANEYISDRNEPIAFPNFSLEECIKNIYHAEYGEIDKKTTVLYGKLQETPTFNFLYLADHLKRLEEQLSTGNSSDPTHMAFIFESLSKLNNASQFIKNPAVKADKLNVSTHSAEVLYSSADQALKNIQASSITPLMNKMIDKLKTFPLESLKQYKIDHPELAVLFNIFELNEEKSDPILERKVHYYVPDTLSTMIDTLNTGVKNAAGSLADHYLIPQKKRCKAIATLYKNYPPEHEIKVLCQRKEEYVDAFAQLLSNQAFFDEFAAFLKKTLPAITDTAPLSVPSFTDAASQLPYIGRLIWDLLPQHFASKYDSQLLLAAFLNYLHLEKNNDALQDLQTKATAFTSALSRTKDFSLLLPLGDPTASFHHLNEDLLETLIEAAYRIQEGFGQRPIDLEERMLAYIEQGLEKALSSFPMMKFITLEAFKTEKVQQAIKTRLKQPANFLRNKGKETLLSALGIQTALTRENLAADYLTSALKNEGQLSAFASCFLQYRAFTKNADNVSDEAFGKQAINLVLSRHLERMTDQKERNDFIEKMYETFETTNTRYFGKKLKTSNNNDTIKLLEHLITERHLSLGTHDPLRDHLIADLVSHLIHGMTLVKDLKEKLHLEQQLFKFTKSLLKDSVNRALPTVLQSTVQLVLKQALQLPVAKLIPQLEQLPHLINKLQGQDNGYNPGESYTAWETRQKPFLQNAVELIGFVSSAMTAWASTLKLITAAMGFTFLNASGLGITIATSAVISIAAANIFKALVTSFKELKQQEGNLSNHSLGQKFLLFGGMFVKALCHATLTNLVSKNILSKIKPILPFLSLFKETTRKNEASFPTEIEKKKEKEMLQGLENARMNAASALIEFNPKDPGALSTLHSTLKTLEGKISECERTFKNEKDARLFHVHFREATDRTLKAANAVKEELTSLQSKIEILGLKKSAAQKESAPLNQVNAKKPASDMMHPLDPTAYIDQIHKHPILKSIDMDYSYLGQSNLADSEQLIISMNLSIPQDKVDQSKKPVNESTVALSNRANHRRNSTTVDKRKHFAMFKESIPLLSNQQPLQEHQQDDHNHKDKKPSISPLKK
ncbi:MAG: hypothetical protein H2069_06570 [Legionella sp.]|nr:hypothetical protein [Legionella sp.]